LSTLVLRKLRTRSRDELRALAAALVLVPIVDLAVRFVGFRRCTHELFVWSEGSRRRLATNHGPINASSLSRLVSVAAQRGPYLASCLPRALVLWFLLRRHGRDPMIVLGVRNGRNGVEAHAWIELDGTSLDELHEGEPFKPLDGFGPVLGAALRREWSEQR
jgi:hypothetical protein